MSDSMSREGSEAENPDRVEIPLKKENPVFILIMLGCFVCLYMLDFNFAFIHRGIIAFVMVSLFIVYGLAHKKPALVIDNAGITFPDYYMNIVCRKHHVKWENIAGILPVVTDGQKLFVIMLNNPEEYTKTMSLFFRIKTEDIAKIYGSPVILRTALFQCADTELDKLLKESFNDHKNRDRDNERMCHV